MLWSIPALGGATRGFSAENQRLSGVRIFGDFWHGLAFGILPPVVSACIADNPTTPSNYTMKDSARIRGLRAFACGNASKSSSEIEGPHAGGAPGYGPSVLRFGGLAGGHAKVYNGPTAG